MLAALPTLAPSSCANAFGTRSAKLLPHFKNLTFMAGLLLARVTQALCKSDVMGRNACLKKIGKANSGQGSVVVALKLASRSTSSRSTAVSASKLAHARLERVVIFGVLQRT